MTAGQGPGFLKNGPSVIISHGFWMRRFGGDARIVGQTITLDGTPTTVVGVLPPSLGFPYADNVVWVPRVFELAGMTKARIGRGAGFLVLTARTKGVGSTWWPRSATGAVWSRIARATSGS